MGEGIVTRAPHILDLGKVIVRAVGREDKGI